MDGYKEAAKIDHSLEEILIKFPIKENAEEWLKLIRTIHTSLHIIQEMLKVDFSYIK